MKVEKPSELGSATGLSSEATPARSPQVAMPADASAGQRKAQVVQIETAARHPRLQSPVPEYQTDRYRLVTPYTHL
jgi:hypothetical protein